MNAVTIVIGTFGDPVWVDRAHVAFRSAVAQTVPATVVHVHGKTLADARNTGAAGTRSPWLIFLDADDTLDPGYVAAMTSGGGQLRQPATLGVYPDGHTDVAPVMIPAKPLTEGNYLVIGTAIQRSMFEQVGGFQEWPIYEDWDLWLRCVAAGANVTQVPDAVYRVGVRPDSRNNQPRQVQIDTYNRIRGAAMQR